MQYSDTRQLQPDPLDGIKDKIRIYDIKRPIETIEIQSHIALYIHLIFCVICINYIY